MLKKQHCWSSSAAKARTTVRRRQVTEIQGCPHPEASGGRTSVLRVVHVSSRGEVTRGARGRAGSRAARRSGAASSRSGHRRIARRPHAGAPRGTHRQSAARSPRAGAAHLGGVHLHGSRDRGIWSWALRSNASAAEWTPGARRYGSRPNLVLHVDAPRGPPDRPRHAPWIAPVDSRHFRAGRPALERGAAGLSSC